MTTTEKWSMFASHALAGLLASEKVFKDGNNKPLTSGSEMEKAAAVIAGRMADHMIEEYNDRFTKKERT